MSIIPDTDMYAQSDKIQEAINKRTTWHDTEENPPQWYDGDYCGCVWAFNKQNGEAVTWKMVAEWPEQWTAWTHTPNVPLKTGSMPYREEWRSR